MINKVAEIVNEALRQSDTASITIEEVLPTIMSHGAMREDVEAAIQTYEHLGVWQRSGDGQTLTLTDVDYDDHIPAA